MKIVYEREKCIGCGSCSAVCPANWKLSEDGKSQLLSSKVNSKTGNYEKEIEKPECNQDAVEGCPAQCIHIEE